MAFADGADALQRRAIGRDEQVVVGRRVRIGPKPLDAIEEVVQRRYWVRADRVGLPPNHSISRTTPSVAPSVSRVRVLVADGEHATRATDPLDDNIRAPSRRKRRGRRSSTLVRLSWRDRRPGAGPSPTTGRGRQHRRRRLLGRGRPRAGPGHRRRQGLPESEVSFSGALRGPLSSSSSWRTRVPRSAVSSSSTCRSGIRFMRRCPAELMAYERHRPPERGDRLGPLLRLADDADPDLRVAQIGRRLDLRDRRKPDARIRDSRVTIDRSPVGTAHRLSRTLRHGELPASRGRRRRRRVRGLEWRTPTCVSDCPQRATRASGGPGGAFRQPAATRLTVCVE